MEKVDHTISSKCTLFNPFFSIARFFTRSLRPLGRRFSFTASFSSLLAFFLFLPTAAHLLLATAFYRMCRMSVGNMFKFAVLV